MKIYKPRRFWDLMLTTAYISGPQMGVPVELLVDIGSTYTIISRSVIESIGRNRSGLVFAQWHITTNPKDETNQSTMVFRRNSLPPENSLSYSLGVGERLHPIDHLNGYHNPMRLWYDKHQTVIVWCFFIWDDGMFHFSSKITGHFLRLKPRVILSRRRENPFHENTD